MSFSISTVILRSRGLLSASARSLACGASSVNLQKRHYAAEKPISLHGRHFISLRDYETDEIKQLLWTACDLKRRMKTNHEVFQPLIGKTMASFFQKRSTRTRTSSEIGIAKLGGYSIFLSPDECHLGVNETVKDTAKVISGFVDIVLARVYGQDILDTLAAEASVPVISGLSDLYHPMQILADFQTLQEHFGQLENLKVAWVGDGNNILHSFMMGCPKLGMDLRAAHPKGYDPDPFILSHAQELFKKHGRRMDFTHDPMEAVAGADVIVTDTWVSMGQEEEYQVRMRDFAGYQVNSQMLSAGSKECVFLHCLPRKQEEVTDDVFYHEKSLVFQEAENRMWTVMSVILHLLQDYKPMYSKPKF